MVEPSIVFFSFSYSWNGICMLSNGCWTILLRNLAILALVAPSLLSVLTVAGHHDSVLLLLLFAVRNAAPADVRMSVSKVAEDKRPPVHCPSQAGLSLTGEEYPGS
jgi:hypothetical protein